MWDNILKPTLVLFAVCIVISGSLAVVNDITKDIIEQRTNEEKDELRFEVMNDADSFSEVYGEGVPDSVKDLPDSVKAIFEGYKGQELAGYVIDVVVKGYGGDISMTVGVNKNGQVIGVKTGDNNETPGLGSKATEPEFISQFNDVGVEDNLTLVKQGKKADNEIQAISGATVSSRAVTDGVQAALTAARIMIKGER